MHAKGYVLNVGHFKLFGAGWGGGGLNELLACICVAKEPASFKD